MELFKAVAKHYMVGYALNAPVRFSDNLFKPKKKFCMQNAAIKREKKKR
jgi:hypothetical protein